MLSEEDRILIIKVSELKKDSVKKVIAEFPKKNWSSASVNCLLRAGVFCNSDVNYLKERLLEEWHQFDQRIIDKAVSQWRQRLHSCIRENREHLTFKRSV